MSETPIRIQLSRKKGWKMPPNTVKVARPGLWGNSWTFERSRGGRWFVHGPGLSVFGQPCGNEEGARLLAVRHFRAWAEKCGPAINQLRGKNLACWCALDQPCHADVLLELANGPICEPVA